MERRTLLKVSGGVVAGGAIGAYLGSSALDRTENDRDEPPASIVEEAYVTPAAGDDVDTPAVWHGTDDHLLVVTAKESHELVTFDATDGSYAGSIGSRGTDLGEFDRPNEVFVIADLAVVVERDNNRIQVLQLPDGDPLGTFGEAQLRRPYGCTVYERDSGYELFVTDDYDAMSTELLDERVKQYRFEVTDDGIQAQFVNSFGETDRPGALEEVETIRADPASDRLMISDEETTEVKQYDRDGTFVDVVTSVFDGNDPEGLALYEEDDTNGYWIFTEQSRPSRFHVFDRDSLEQLATFRGETTENTDGVWLTQRSFGPFDRGAFVAVDDDYRTAVFDWGDVLGTIDRYRNN